MRALLLALAFVFSGANASSDYSDGDTAFIIGGLGVFVTGAYILAADGRYFNETITIEGVADFDETSVKMFYEVKF